MYMLYHAGPRSYGWSGVCEVDPTQQHYRHHPQWPTRTESATWVPFREPLARLVTSGCWVSTENPDLRLPEGL